MAIILKCSQCQEQLEVDDAFAGGVCRCVHCGALSHVPLQSVKLDKKGRPTSPPPMAKPVVGTPEELEKIEVVQAREFIAHKKRMGLLAIFMMVIALAMVAVFGWAVYKMFGPSGEDPDAPVEVGSTGTQDNPLVVKKGPNFLGVDLAGSKIAYVQDTGNSLQYVISGMTEAIRKSVATLKDKEFVVVGWPNPETSFMGETTPAEPPPVFPAQGLAAGGSEPADLADFLNNLAASGKRDPAPAVAVALQRGADTIVLITGGDLEAAEARAVAAQVKGKSVKLLAVVVPVQPETDFPQLKGLVGEKGVTVVTEENLTLWTTSQ